MAFANWLALVLLPLGSSKIFSIEDFGAVADSGSGAQSVSNQKAINAAFAAAQKGDSVLVPVGKDFMTVGGLNCSNKVGLTLSIQGKLVGEPDRHLWPSDRKGDVYHFLTISASSHVTLTGSGSIDGNGIGWWDAMILGELAQRNNRPNTIDISDSSDLLIEKLTIHNSPKFNIKFAKCARVVVRYIDITTDRFKQRELKAKLALKRAEAAGLGSLLLQPLVRQAIVAAQHRGQYPGESWKDWLLDHAVKLLPDSDHLQPEDLNTDGIDPNGIDFHIHDCNIINDDDSIAVKPSNAADLHKGGPTDCTQNILIENMVMTGFGASIGSVPPHADVNCVRNITFRNISMPSTGKGIYVKSNPSCGREVNIKGEEVQTTALIEKITFDNIKITRPSWWAIWIGPQQQQEPGDKLREKCALQYPLFHSTCPTQGCATFKDILLKDVTIEDPLLSPGVIMGNATNPMQNLTFDNVNVVFGHGAEGIARGRFPYGRDYLCHDADIHVVGSSSPEPCKAAPAIENLVV